MTTAEQRAIAAAAARGEAAARMPIGRVALAEAWEALGTVMDPEVPVVSIVELGIVRDVAWRGDELVVTVTPTYSGCPATDVIIQSIRDALAARSAAPVRIETRLAPAWTTDWIAPEAKVRLREYGIAPPHVAAPRIDVTGISPLRRAREVVPCPRCNSPHTTLTAQFGSTACKALYRCEDCREPFDYFKPH
jgi:ring-1,2-phenylacetyl-CoA epoxidase subunit PaaD